METTDYCSYELSKALKACGFDEPCDHCYVVDKDTESNIEFTEYASRSKWNSAKIGGSKYPYKHISAPTLAHAQKWLREKKNWHIIVEPIIWESLTYEFKLWHKFRGYENANRGFYFSSYERALSAGISAALELIKEGE